MKLLLMIFSGLLFSTVSSGETIKIQLSEYDQGKLAKELSKADAKYRSEELVDEDTASWYVLKKYRFLDESAPFYIHCSEKFRAGSAVGVNGKCEVGFNYSAEDTEEVRVHDGFMPAFAIAELKGTNLAKDLYGTIGNGTGSSVWFNSKEQISLTHPSTGKQFNVFKLRIDCKRDSAYREFNCQVGAVK